MEIAKADDTLCIGDYVSLYSGDAQGYVYAMLSSTTFAYLAVNSQESRDQPLCGDIQLLSFKICAINRYKLLKEYNRLHQFHKDSKDKVRQVLLEQAKLSAEAEAHDNDMEQARQRGKKVLYGQMIQLQHAFTGKYVHISTQNTSPTESSNMQVTLNPDNAGAAQFKVMPRFKVKGEGDLVQIEDQVILESVKSPGQYLHVGRVKCKQYIPVYENSFELNLSVRYSGLTLVRRFTEHEKETKNIRAGQPIRFFHTELEAYLVCEGSFNEVPVEDVHLRIRAVDQSKPKTLMKPSSAICYWQLELVENAISGGIVKWKQQVRIRHMCTRKFLSLSPKGDLALTDDRTDANTVFRLHQVLKEDGEINDATYCRIQHAATKNWLHASKEDYNRRGLPGEGKSSNSMAGLIWSQAPLRKVEMTQKSQCDDAFTIYAVEPQLVNIFNYVAGYVPLIQRFIFDHKTGSSKLEPIITQPMVKALLELRDFIVFDIDNNKNRTKLLRNLRLVDLLFRVLQIPLSGSSQTVQQLLLIFEECYDLIYQYLYGESRKNELYCARYLDFLHQLRLQKEVKLNAARTFMAVVWDNRKIIDRIPKPYVEEYINLLQQSRCYEYLELLSVLCVCTDMSMPTNQNYITQKWLVDNQNSHLVYYTELGQNIGKQPDKVYVSMDNKQTWKLLSKLAQRYATVVGPKDLENELTSRQISQAQSILATKKSLLKIDFSEETTSEIVRNFKFLKSQLDLFGKLCRGRNSRSIDIITKQLGYLTWEEAFLCVKDESLPAQLRAKYCELITTMFVDVDDNINVLDKIELVFVYADVPKESQVKMVPGKSATTRAYFSDLREWLFNFCEQNRQMVDSDVRLNTLLTEVLKMLHYLVKFGYFSSSLDVHRLLRPLLSMLDGRNDLPTRSEVFNTEPEFNNEGDLLKEFRATKRFHCAHQETVRAKHEAMRVIDLFFSFQFNSRLEKFLAEFKFVQSQPHDKLAALLEPEYKHDDEVDAEAFNRLSTSMFSRCSYFQDLASEPEPTVEIINSFNLFRQMSAPFVESEIVKDSVDIVSILMDVSCYKSSLLVQMSMWLLNRYYSAYSLLFERALLSRLLVTDKSVSVHRIVERDSHVIRRMIGSKMTDADVETMCSILTRFCRVCHLDDDPEERHPMNQIIMYNSGILNDLFDLVSQDFEITERAEYTGLRRVFAKCFDLMRVLAKDNAMVQNHLFDRLEALLNCAGAETHLALALVEVFTGNKDTCMKVLPQHIAKIMSLVAQYGSRVPEFLDLLNTIVKVEELDLPLKRNQECIMTYLMQHRADIAQCLDQNPGVQFRLLRSGTRTPESDFMVALVDLLATCAEGENKSIESKNQSIYRVGEVLNVLTDPGISAHNKRPYARFLLWVYLNTASGLIESGAGDLPHDVAMWKLLGMWRQEFKQAASLANENPRLLLLALKSTSAVRHSNEDWQTERATQNIHDTLKYLFEGVLPVISSFFKTVYLKDQDNYPGEIEEVNRLTLAAMEFVDAVLPLLTNKKYSKYLITGATSLVSVCTLPSKTTDAFKQKYLSGTHIKCKATNSAHERYREYYSSEEELNKKLSIFSKNFRLAYSGKNSIRAQIGYPADEEYTNPGQDDELPLGKEFQQHMACFIDTNYGYSDPRRFAMTGKLVEQLCISNQLELRNEKERIEQEILDVKCLQLLRGAVHNEIVKQPDNVDSDEYKRASSRIAQVQNAVNGHQAMLKVLPNLVKPSDNIAREVLNFLAAMLYNGNADVQESMYEYFNSTREEKFFFTMHDRISMSSNSLRENRALINQQRSKIDEKMMELRSQLDLLNKDPDAAKNLRSTEQGARLLHFLEQKSKSGGGAGSHARGMHHYHHQQHQQQPISKSALFADLLPNAWRNSSNSSRKSFPDTDSRTRQDSPGSTAEVAPTGTQTLLRLNKTDIEDLATQIVMEDENLQMKDDGHIELVLRVLAFICDGQNTHLQDYLREQPDNMKSYNLVSKTVEYLSLVYISVTRSNISLVTQLIKTLLEFSSGNLKNQIVCYDSKVCDYLNYLLRSQQIYNKCDFDEEMELKTAIAELIMALIEENIRCDKDSEAAGYAQILGENSNGYSKAKPNSVVVKDTIGPEVVCQMFADFYERYHSPHLQLDKDDREDLLNVGFKYFHIFKRFQDLERGKELRLEDYLNFRPSVANLKEEICKFYESNTMSIEVLKDGNLQKVYFRVRDKKVLRQEVKDEFKYEVDRSSAANKLRDFCDWLKEIINDIQWQKRVLSSRVGAFFVHGWKAFNMACILLSLIICCIVLATWKASNDAGNPIPIRPKPYSTAVLVLGIAHNIFSLFVLISYFLCNKPYVPTREKVNAYWCRILSIETKASVAVLSKIQGNLQTSVFSFGTFYYIMFLAFSLLGTPLHGYFFAFHLLHIANHNQMLKRVFQAVTRNGLSLVWVMIYSLAIFYIYALICFAYYREIFDEEKGNYCSDMFQCTITVIRRGLIFGMYDEVEYFDVPRNRSFNYHLAKTAFDISFFIIITTIGLNIVFGIIVDTFSELRDAKWRIDKDMSSVCFICSKNSYDFEHYGGGFKKHIVEEHNQWAYLFFFLHLNETRFNDYTAIELYVWKLYKKDRLDFFPMNRSLTLQAAEDAKDEAKMDTLLSQVAFLVHRRKEEDAFREREWQEAAQRHWEEQQKKASRRAQEQQQSSALRRRAVVELLTSSSEDEDYN